MHDAEFDEPSQVAVLDERVVAIEAEVDQLRAELRCPRCSTPPPPEPRWPGDLHARDDRGPHQCGRRPWAA